MINTTSRQANKNASMGALRLQCVTGQARRPVLRVPGRDSSRRAGRVCQYRVGEGIRLDTGFRAWGSRGAVWPFRRARGTGRRGRGWGGDIGLRRLASEDGGERWGEETGHSGEKRGWVLSTL